MSENGEKIHMEATQNKRVDPKPLEQSSGPARNDVRGNQASLSAPTGHGAWAWPKSLIQDALLSLSGSKVFFFHFYARTWLLYS